MNSRTRLQQWIQKAPVAMRALAGLVVKVCGALIALLLSIVLARNLGPDGFGVYAYALALLTLLGIPCQVGLPTLVVRETVRAHAAGSWGLMRGLWRWSTAATSMLALVVGILSLGVCWVVRQSASSDQIVTFIVGFGLVPLTALGNLRGAALRGLGHVLVGQAPEIILRPGLFLLLLFCLIHAQWTGQLTPALAMGVHGVAAGLAFVAGALLLMKRRPMELTLRPTPVYHRRDWINSSVPLAIAAAMTLVTQQSDILLLGFFAPKAEVGYYRAAQSVASLVTFGLQTVILVAGTDFARLHAVGDQRNLQRTVLHSSRAVFAFAAPATAFLTVFGEPLLGKLFGPAFSHAYAPLVILACGQLVISMFGPVGALLNMTGHEKDTALGLSLAALTDVLVGLLLIPRFGVVGAATANVMAMLVWYILLWNAVRKRLGLETIAFRAGAGNERTGI